MLEFGNLKLGLSRTIVLLLLAILIACPKKRKEVVEPVITETKYVVKKGDNLENVLKKLLSQSDMNGVILEALGNAGFSFKKCKPGDSIIVTKKDDEFLKLEYRKTLMDVYYVLRDSGTLCVAVKFPYIDTVQCLLKGALQSTLYESILEIGETPYLVFRYADIFAWEVDFITDTRTGDSFYVFIEKTFCDSVFLDYGNVKFARYNGELGDYYGIYYRDPDAHEDYYNLKGESLRKSLLKSPLRYSYISSYFSKRRFHPILKVWRPHHGLDYVAPIGTPVATIGDGIITYKGWKNGYGNLIEVKHKNNFKTRYGHLSKFVKGLYNGKRLKMGELIGYVGSTGLSTGPHLHFEMQKNGVAINPLRVKIPRAPSVKKNYMSDFQQHCDSLLTVIDALSHSGREEVTSN
ncbi:MAG: M23 family metallopeptidase [candidate division WOR-3 bacterium]|nr:MAG: M23 family metallopeptidase [candidate division WOR-3 bacterium]